MRAVRLLDRERHLGFVGLEAFEVLRIRLTLPLGARLNGGNAFVLLAILGGGIVLFHNSRHHAGYLALLLLDQLNSTIHRAAGFDPLVDQ